jgi:hypothetical protein
MQIIGSEPTYYLLLVFAGIGAGYICGSAE